MATSSEVLSMIYPDGGWIAVGDDFDGIQFLECEPITKAEYEKAETNFESWKAKQKSEKEIAKAALLIKLGITADEMAILFS